jgi:hypothetical protein
MYVLKKLWYSFRWFHGACWFSILGLDTGRDALSTWWGKQKCYFFQFFKYTSSQSHNLLQVISITVFSQNVLVELLVTCQCVLSVGTWLNSRPWAGREENFYASLSCRPSKKDIFLPKECRIIPEKWFWVNGIPINISWLINVRYSLQFASMNKA